MNQFAVMTFMFAPWWSDGRTTHEALLQGFADAGAQGVEPFHRDFTNDPTLLKRYKKTLADTGLKVAAVDVICNLVYGNAAQRQEGLDEMQRGLDLCVELDADIAHVAGHRLREGVTPGNGRKMIAEGLMEAVEFASRHDMVVAIEDFNPSPDLVCTADDCLEILDLTGDAVKLVFDTGNFEAVGENAEENFDRCADRICHCHFKDFARDATVTAGHKACDLGTGMIPNAQVARRLRERGYDGWVALETFGRNDVPPIDAVRRELPLLKSWFGA